MKVKMILPALAEARGLYRRTTKYKRFPPLALATLAAYLSPEDEIDLQDEHVEAVHLDDEPDLVVIQVYVTSAYRSYAIADHYRRKGSYVCLGGLHVTSLPREAAQHADSIFLGPGEDTWPRFLRDFAQGAPRKVYRSTHRSLIGAPPLRRDLIKRNLYLVPNTLVVSRGCPHHCDFCYKDSFYRGGKSYYTMAVDQALAEIERLPGKHLCFLDDNLLANPKFASQLFAGMAGMGRIWIGAGTVQSVLTLPKLLELAVRAGLRSLFIGFETLSAISLSSVHKYHNLSADYNQAIRRLHDLGVMVNASIVFGMDGDDKDTFDWTVDWTVQQGLESATFHIVTPYPGTALYDRLESEGRILTHDWDLYDTRHAVFKPARMSVRELEEGYWRANRRFGQWRSIWRSAATKTNWHERLRHLMFSGGLRHFNAFWMAISRAKRISRMIPLLESLLEAFGKYPANTFSAPTGSDASPTPGEEPIPHEVQILVQEFETVALGCQED